MSAPAANATARTRFLICTLTSASPMHVPFDTIQLACERNRVVIAWVINQEYFIDNFMRHHFIVCLAQCLRGVERRQHSYTFWPWKMSRWRRRGDLRP